MSVSNEESMKGKLNCNNVELRASVNDGSTSAFMWETFMTKPYHDSGVCIYTYIINILILIAFCIGGEESWRYHDSVAMLYVGL